MKERYTNNSYTRLLDDRTHWWILLSVSPRCIDLCNGGVMFDARLHADVISRSHSQGSGMPSAFLDIVVVFALFRRSTTNLFISWHYSTKLDFDL